MELLLYLLKSCLTLIIPIEPNSLLEQLEKRLTCHRQFRGKMADVLDLPKKTSDFFFDLGGFISKMALIHKFGIGVQRNAVLDYIRIYPRHILVRPCENIFILFQQISQFRFFLVLMLSLSRLVQDPLHYRCLWFEFHLHQAQQLYLPQILACF